MVERPRCTNVYCHWAAPSNSARVVITQSWRALCCQDSLVLGIAACACCCEKPAGPQARHDYYYYLLASAKLNSAYHFATVLFEKPELQQNRGTPPTRRERCNSNSTRSRPDCQSRHSLLPHQTSPHLGELCFCQCVCSSRDLSSTLAGPTCRSLASSLPAPRTMSVAHSQGAAARDKHLRLCTCRLIVPSARIFQSSNSKPSIVLNPGGRVHQ